MNIEHNSRQIFFREPRGAVVCGTAVRFRLAVDGAGIPRSVRLIYKPDRDGERHIDMPYIFSIASASIYEVTLTMPDEAGLIWYYFEVATDSGVVYYGNNTANLGGSGEMSFSVPSHSFQITVYKEEYKTPDWFKDAVAYQIFPDRFFNGNPDGSFSGDRTDIIKRNWGDMPFYKAEQFGGVYKSNDFFGGNLEGIIKKLPYLEDMGITVIYLNPIFKASSNHKYDTGSYEEIDPMFGDEETFSRLCSEAKKRGIRIILDGVFNHTGDDSMYFNKYGNYDSVGAYQSKTSPYYSWYRFIDYPDTYESWWGMTTLPQIEESSTALREYMLSGADAIVKKWIRLGASGWRLDVVDELPDFYVKELREGVKSVDPDAVIIGEVWEDASNKTAYGERREYFLGNELDSVMNYPVRNAMIDFALCHCDAYEFDRRIMSIKENYPQPAYYSLLNIVSSHDVERIVTLMGDVPDRHRIDREHQASFRLEGYALAVARRRAELIYGMVLTMPGVPCIYYGDELGMQGYADPFCRACYPWDREDETDPHGEMRSWIRELIRLRKSSKAFSTGDFNYIYRIGYTYAYLRRYNDEKYVAIVNCDSSSHCIRLDAARYGLTRLDAVFGDGAPDSHHSAPDGIFCINTAGHSFTVYKGFTHND